MSCPHFIHGTCRSCGIFIKETKQRMDHLLRYGVGSTSMSCCGGKGISIWKDSSKQWECSDCGSPKSNDPDYLYGSTPEKKGPWRITDWKTPTTPQCECGADKTYGPGSALHSATMPCPLYKAIK